MIELNFETKCTLYDNIIEEHSHIDAFEVHPVKKIEEYDCFEICEDEDADMWSVYQHLTEGGIECIADFETEKDALSFQKILEIACKMFVKS
jgi:hypothetical protein